MKIRSETPADHDAIRALNLAAFGGTDEGVLVDRLRAEGDLLVSLVALREDQVVGHIAFSRLRLRGAKGDQEAVALAPMAVEPALQRQGIGSALVWAGLERFTEVLVVVLGHPEYYPRFGFSAENAKELRCAWSGPALMATRPAAGDLIYAGGFSQWT